jgi:hypothetical protein
LPGVGGWRRFYSKAWKPKRPGSRVTLASQLASVPIESEPRLNLFVLTRFLHANRYPLRWKTL